MFQDKLKVGTGRAGAMLAFVGAMLAPGVCSAEFIDLDAPSVATKTGTPPVGIIEDGYRYKGGDPSQQRNWEMVGSKENQNWESLSSTAPSTKNFFADTLPPVDSQKKSNLVDLDKVSPTWDSLSSTPPSTKGANNEASPQKDTSIGGEAIPSTSIMGATGIVLLSVAMGLSCAYLLWIVLGKSVKGSTPVATGRRWMNWVVVAASIKPLVSTFSGLLNGRPGKVVFLGAATAVAATVVFAAVAFAVGALWAFFRNRARNGVTTSGTESTFEVVKPQTHLEKPLETTMQEKELNEVNSRQPVPVAVQSTQAQADPSSRLAPSSRSVPTVAPIDEDTIYNSIANELETGNTDKGLWTRLFAECNGDEKQVKVLYIKRRAEKLIEAEKLRHEQVNQKEAERQHHERFKADEAEKSRRRDAGLADPLLIAAIEAGNWSTACQLLESGVSPFGANEDGVALRDLAKQRGDQQIVDLLKIHEAKSMEPQVAKAVNKFQSGTDLTVDDVILLVDSAVKYVDLVQMRASKTGYTLLHWCGRLGLDRSVATLLSLNADASVCTADGKEAHQLTRSTALAIVLAEAAKV